MMNDRFQIRVGIRWSNWLVLITVFACLFFGSPITANAQTPSKLDSAIKASDLDGRWKGSEWEFNFQTTPDGQVTLQIVGGNLGCITFANANFTGKFVSTGFYLKSRLLSVDDLCKIMPLKLRKLALAKNPNYRLRVKVKMYNKNAIFLTLYQPAIVRNRGESVGNNGFEFDGKKWNLLEQLNVEEVLVRLPCSSSAKTITEKKNKVLCYIRLEAQRLAKLDKSTVKGSTFLAGLKIHLAEYLKDPTRENAESAIDRIGENATPFTANPLTWFALKSGLRGGVRIPGPFRALYQEISEDRVYPALRILSLEEGVNEIRLLDVPFLLGEDYPSRRLSADEYVKGGRNLSNVMHWATGVKYHHFPDEALQELFLGYEYWHMEGFDTFGEDAINDLVAEEEGRLLGKALFSRSITNQNLVRIIDESFIHSRAWVGAMIRIRQKELDEQILAERMPQSNIWWGHKGHVHLSLSPWTPSILVGDRKTSPPTIHKMIELGGTHDEIISSKLVKKLVKVYELIYAVEEWEKRFGRMNLTPRIRKTLNGDYDNQFKKSDKDYETEQDWWRP